MATNQLTFGRAEGLVSMSSPIAIGRRMAVWLVALAASLEIIGHLVVALIDEKLAHVWVWLALLLAAFALAASIESVKRFVGE